MNAFEQEVVIGKIYSKFRVLPNIQEHMLRVASLVEIYLELMGEEVLSALYEIEGVLLDINPRFKRIYNQTKMLNSMADRRAPGLLKRVLRLRH